MISDYSTKGMIDLKDELGKDIRDQRFDRFLFLTYSLSDDLLELLPMGSKAIIYYNRKGSSKPRVQSENVKTEVFKNHAKIYCMWGELNIKCWLGSFNFTEAGISTNIEWAASFEGKLRKPLQVGEVVKGEASSNVSNNQVINQIIDFISHVVNREPPVVSDRLFQNSTHGPILLHNLATNTLQKCIIGIANRAKKNLSITYITPFVNKSGVESFSKLFQHKFPLKKVCFQVLTNIPDPSYSSGTFLNSEAISNFKRKFKDFQMLKRKRGKGGTFLKNGTEISPSFLHLKLVHFSFINEDNEQEIHSIFTSANLTEEAWRKSSSQNVEVGLWVRDKSSNQIIRSFLSNFEFCFSEPDQEELKAIDETFHKIESGRKFAEFWIEDLVKERLSLTENELRLDWNDCLPSIYNLKCTFYFRNIVTRERLSESVLLKTKDNSFLGNFKNLSEKKNMILEHVNFTFDTDFEPPEIKIKKEYIADFVSSENGKKYFMLKEDLPGDWNEIVVNNKKYRFERNQKLELPTMHEIKSLSLRKKRDITERSSIYIDIYDQPHFTGDFFTNSMISSTELGALGKFLEVSLTTNSHLDPPFDTIRFFTNNHSCLDPVAISRSNGSLRYYFRPKNLSGLRLTATATSPYNKYFRNKEIVLQFPTIQETSEISNFWRDAFDHKIAGLGAVEYPLDKLISPFTRVQIYVRNQPIHNLPPHQMKYFCKEDSLTYQEPLLYDLNDAIKSREPYSRIAYWGVIDVLINGKAVKLLSAKRHFIVRDTAIRDFHLREEIPRSLPFSKIKITDPVGWIDVVSEKVQYQQTYAIDPSLLELQVWKNGKKLEERKFCILEYGKKWCIPILREELDTLLEFIFILRIKDENFSDYSPAFKIRRYRLKQHRRGLKFRRQFPPPTSDFMIQNEPKASLSNMGLKMANLSSRKFGYLTKIEKKLFRFYKKTGGICPPSEKDIVVCLAS